MKTPSITRTLLSVACLSGLVSCYPVTSVNPNLNRDGSSVQVSGLKTPAELEEAARQKKEALESKKNALQRSKERLEREERSRLDAEKKEAAGYKEEVINRTIDPVLTTPKPKIVVPNVVKFAAPVPGKSGFVFNPFTQNQVDVRGIPSGTKVRDPHDSDPAHIFKVP